ncbi:hypothetical protein A33Q_0180 [Indibacter alkaliphilus LW1]|uniref:Uncharacterized protein n=1 Tax=Indibacter alkaliphilus (strain CCUG 57479 / KCTC 22604 / LW1) TaxID=1189612 RepID=S2E5V1_INDAL|nr:DEAD/DEAH box helicase family protein [Indibacter alkaliphilus]EPA00012.1 hypothetical protein A33Q_0180 [Indibacter alkaliphilus LW1]
MKKEPSVTSSPFDVKDPKLVVKEETDMLIITNINPDTKRHTKLSEVLNFLPAGIIYKAETGMGATTLELQCPRNSIIVEPLRSTAYTKALNPRNPYPAKFVGTEPNSRKGTTPEEIKKYLRETKTFKKFLVVADSLPKLLKEIPIEELSSYHLMLDESDSFQLDATFRDSMEKCLDIYKTFPSNRRSMVTATPLEFSDPELNEENSITIRYRDSESRQVTFIETNTGLEVIADQIFDHFQNAGLEPCTKMVVAINHIEDILKVIETVTEDGNPRSLEKWQIQILCGSSSKKKVAPFYDELKGGTLTKDLTFITSAYFTGVDIEEKFHLITYVRETPDVLRLSEKKLKQVSGRGRKGLLSETIVYDSSTTSGLESFDLESLLSMAQSQVEALRCIAYTYGTNPLMKSRMVDTFEKLLKIGDVGTSRLVRRHEEDKFQISYLNIDAALEFSRVLEHLYRKPNGLKDALEKSGCVIKKITRHSKTKILEESVISKAHAIDEQKNLEKLLMKLKSRETDLLDLLEKDISELERSALVLFDKFRINFEEDAFFKAVINATSKGRKGEKTKRLQMLENRIQHLIEDPSKGFLYNLLQEIPLNPERGVWYSENALVERYQRAALHAGKPLPRKGTEIDHKAIIGDIREYYDARSQKKKEGLGYYIYGRADTNNLLSAIKRYATNSFSAADFSP